MIKLRRILKETNEESIKQVLSSGFISIERNSHLVAGQVSNNKNDFLDALDVKKLAREFGTPKSVLGAGVFGAVYSVGSGKVLKITFDYREAPFLYKLSKNPLKGMVEVDKVRSFEFGETNAYGIVRDNLTPITQTKYSSLVMDVLIDMKRGDREIDYTKPIKQETQKALNLMYEMDPNWRGTHLENIGIQNGSVVLYDGFSKNIKLNPSIIPTLDLKYMES